MNCNVEKLKRLVLDNYQSPNYKVDKIFEYLEEIRQNQNTNVWQMIDMGIESYINRLSLNDFYKLIYNKHLNASSIEKADEYKALLKLYNEDYYRTVKDIENAK